MPNPIGPTGQSAWPFELLAEPPPRSAPASAVGASRTASNSRPRTTRVRVRCAVVLSPGQLPRVEPRGAVRAATPCSEQPAVLRAARRGAAQPRLRGARPGAAPPGGQHAEPLVCLL